MSTQPTLYLVSPPEKMAPKRSMNVTGKAIVQKRPARSRTSS